MAAGLVNPVHDVPSVRPHDSWFSTEEARQTREQSAVPLLTGGRCMAVGMLRQAGGGRLDSSVFRPAAIARPKSPRSEAGRNRLAGGADKQLTGCTDRRHSVTTTPLGLTMGWNGAQGLEGAGRAIFWSERDVWTWASNPAEPPGQDKTRQD